MGINLKNWMKLNIYNYDRFIIEGGANYKWEIIGRDVINSLTLVLKQFGSGAYEAFTFIEGQENRQSKIVREDGQEDIYLNINNAQIVLKRPLRKRKVERKSVKNEPPKGKLLAPENANEISVVL